MIQFALKERYPGQMGNGGQVVAASAPTIDSRVSNIIALAVQMTDDVASLESDLKAQLHDGQSRKTISIAQDRKKKMDLNMVSELHKYCRDLVSRTSTMLTSIEEDKDQVASSEYVFNEEVHLMDSKKKANETDDKGSVTFHAEKVLSAIDKEKMTGDTSLTKREFPTPVVSSLSATIGCSVVPIPDTLKLDLNSDNSNWEKELNRITKPAFAQETSDPSQKEISEINQNKKDGDFDKDFRNNSDGQKDFPGSSSQYSQSLPSNAFYRDDSVRHGTPKTRLSLQIGPHKSYEELHFGRPPEEKNGDDAVAHKRQENKAEAATQTSQQDLLGRCSNVICNYRSVMTQCGTVTDAGQPSEEEGTVGGVVCPSGQGGGCTGVNDPTDYRRSPDPTSNQAHSTQRDSIGELIVEEQDEELTIAPQFAPYGPPAFIHLENDSYPRCNLYDFEGPEELYELSAPSPPPSLELEEQLTRFHAQVCRVEILDTDGHTLLNTLLAGPRLVQNQALQIASRVVERSGLRDFTLRWPGGDLIPWNTILEVPSDQGSSSGPTTVTVQVQPAQDGEGEWRVHWTEGHDPILQPPDNQEEACLLEGFHGQQQEASSTAQSGQAGQAQPLSVQPDTAGEQECGDSRCTICKEVRGQLVRTPCRHLFHPDCLYHWLAETDSCPNCRKPVNKCREN
ncbi:uncharacterized protein LOC118408423 isoform X2 [Branchiostoma floridae]|uniref:RING-type E3 ubiquitin transferase n=1 Tax=Branchiostoma floridae TaxID=7739 RepID=A0A9J7HSK8_BRAFL|nr:uncharacterized protein LOC118408423 isoform X2 [Branchiostoma floridae]